MERPVLRVVRAPGGLDPVTGMATGPALLALAAQGRLPGPVLLLTRPDPVVGFSRLDTLAPGFAAAVGSAASRGFGSAVRGPGGRAAAWHQGCLLTDLVVPQADATSGLRERFAQQAGLVVEALTSLGAQAAVGAVPGEYCPGEFSVHVRARHGPSRGEQVKVAGTAQRVVRGAWQFGTVLVVADPEPLREVLVGVYAALGLDWRPASAGAVCDAVPEVRVDDAEDALLAGFARSWAPTDVAWGPVDAAAGWPGGAEVLRVAEDLRERHEPVARRPRGPARRAPP